MDERSQAALVLIFQALLREIRSGENFDLYRFSDKAVYVQASAGTGQGKWTVLRIMPVSDLSSELWNGATVEDFIADLFDRLRRPGGAG